MSRYEALLACIRSGQLSARQIEAHLRDDPGFAAWWREQAEETAPPRAGLFREVTMEPDRR